MIRRLFFYFLGNLAGLYLSFRYIDGVQINNGLYGLLVSAFVLTLAYIFLRPIFKLLFGPLIVLTLGLFFVVINGLILWVVDKFVNFISFSNLSAIVLTTLILSVISLIISLLFVRK